MTNDEDVTAPSEEPTEQDEGFVAPSVVDLEAGLALGVLSARPRRDADTASAYIGELVKPR